MLRFTKICKFRVKPLLKYTTKLLKYFFVIKSYKPTTQELQVYCNRIWSVKEPQTWTGTSS